LSIAYTTAARASLALSTLPLLTMVTAAALGIEKLTWRKSAGVAIAVAGVRGGARERPCRRAGRRLARRPHHGGGRLLHGALQRLVPRVHRPLEPARVPHRRHGRGRGLPCGHRGRPWRAGA